MTLSSDQFSLLVKVANKKTEAKDVCTIDLVDPHGRELPAFEAGAHLNIWVSDSIIRQYSLSNDPTERYRYRLAVLRESDSRGGSVAMHDDVKNDDLLLASAPRNHFALARDAKRHLLFAGGIGITPILAMAHKLAAEKADFELHYATKSAERTAFKAEIEQSAFADNARFYFSDSEHPFRKQLPSLVPEPESGTHVYFCGPASFIDAVTQAFSDRGWNKNQLHTEYFVAADVDTSDDDSFEVELASSGEIYKVPADRTVFEVLDEAGVFIPTSCEQGVCGTCLTRVIEGTPEHRDMFMDDDEHAANDQFTPCCSRAKSAKLLIDL